jgi:hypothetical protein
LMLYMCWLGKISLGFSRWPEGHPGKPKFGFSRWPEGHPGKPKFLLEALVMIHRLYAVQGSDASVRDDLSKGLNI